MSKFKSGMYVRYPIDEDFPKSPRVFVLGQIVSLNELSEVAEIAFYDLFNCKQYYDAVPKENKEVPIRNLRRSDISKGCLIELKSGGKRVKIIAKEKKYNDKDNFMYYYIQADDSTLSAKKICESELRASFHQADFYPLGQLATYELQNPSWFKNRVLVSHTMHILDNAVYGFKILAGCRVLLMPHQIYTIVRCLEDRPVRYLLGDEVGLGKTIEACAVLKIMESQSAVTMKKLFILPASLVDQWKNELYLKFGIDSCVFSPGKGFPHCCIVPAQKLADAFKEGLLDQKWDFCIVDEVHHLLEDSHQYDIVKKLSLKIENILLLSATPVLERKDEYLSLLILLNPALYGQMKMEDFELMLLKQRKIQRKIYSILRDMDEYHDYSSDILENLLEVAKDLQNDTLLGILKGTDLNSEDEGIENVRLALAYICEFYRIERRLIRNRREVIRESMPQREMIFFPYEMAGADVLYYEENVYDALLDWIQDHNKPEALQQDYLNRQVLPLLASFFSSPWAFEQEIKSHNIEDNGLAIYVKKWREAADAEFSIFKSAAASGHISYGRLINVADYINHEFIKLSSDINKIVVFTSYLATAKRFSDLALEKWGSERCAFFYKGMSQEDLNKNADRFQSSPECRIMICDDLGGEGRNFQIADCILHIDLPWSANALEQRIGRLDRIGRDKNKIVKSIVFFAKNTVEEHLFNLWNDGLNVFRSSLSGLEIILGELNQKIALSLSEDVRYGLSTAMDGIVEYSKMMKDSVAEEQYFDAAAVLYRPLSRQLERMIDQHRESENSMFTTAMMTWSAQAGLNAEYPNDISSIVSFGADSFSIHAAQNALLVPPEWKSYSRWQDKHKGLINGTFDRKLAIVREDLLFYAPGDVVFDSIVENALISGRGRACAFMKYADFHFKGIALVWAVTPDIKPLLDMEEDIRYLTQFRGFLPLEPVYTFFPLDKKSEDVESEMLKKILLEKWGVKNSVVHLGERSRGEGEMSKLEQFRSEYPPKKWIDCLSKARDFCGRAALRIVRETTDLSRARDESSRFINAVKASDIYFGKEKVNYKRLEKVYEAVLGGIENPEITIDSAAYIYISDGQ